MLPNDLLDPDDVPYLVDKRLEQAHEHIWNMFIRTINVVGLTLTILSGLLDPSQVNISDSLYFIYLGSAIVSTILHISPVGYKKKLMVIVALTYIVGTCSLLGYGGTGVPRLLYFVGVLIITNGVGHKWGVLAIMVTAGTFFAIITWRDQIPLPFLTPLPTQLDPKFNDSYVFIYIFFCSGTVALITMMNEAIKKAFHNQLKLTVEVEKKSRQLEVALEREQEINQIRSNLINVVSHEFRTPLTVISLSSKMLKRKGSKGELTPADSKKYHGQIDENLRRLADLIDIVVANKPDTDNELNRLIEEVKEDSWVA